MLDEKGRHASPNIGRCPGRARARRTARGGTEAVERKNGLYNHWLASTAYRFLCRQIGVRVLLCDCEWFSFRPQDKGPGLMWFAYEEDHLIDTVT